MSKITIGIVEDEAIIAEDIAGLLQELGYDTLDPCDNYADAITMLTNGQPDLVILDINLRGRQTGIDIGRYVREQVNIPFIYLTANSDAATIAAAKETCPNAYLIKPFHKADLYATIEIGLYNYNNAKSRENDDRRQMPPLLKKSLFIKEGEYFRKVNFDDILFLSSDHVYVIVHTLAKNFLVRTTMQQYIENFDPTKFFRVHRSYAVNVDKIDKINASSIIVNGNEVPISKAYRDELLKALNVI